MDIQQAVKVLGLTGNESIADIKQAYQTKLLLVEEKCQSAPTVVLKQKFEKLKTELKHAQQVLLDNQKQASRSPLSQTKMADLPGINY